MIGLEGTHHEICAIELGSRCTVRIVRLRNADVVERLHERSERWYRCADQRPCQPYLNPDSWCYKGEAFVFRTDRQRESSQMLSGEANNPRTCQNGYILCPDVYSRESGCECSHDKQFCMRAYHDT
jgi:hypothetical protein